MENPGYRQVLGQFASGVTVISAWREPGGPDGVTVSAFSALSLEPPLVLACIGRESDCFTLLRGAPWFGVNILHAGQAPVALAFAELGASKAAAVRRWPRLWLPPAREHGAGPPLLGECLAQLSCRRERVVDAGDHFILVGEVVGLGVRDAPAGPLLYYASAFHEVA